MSGNFRKRNDFFKRGRLAFEAAQFEIRADCRILKQKPDATMALESDKKEFPPDKEKVSKLITLLKEMIIKINQSISNKSETGIY